MVLGATIAACIGVNLSSNDQSTIILDHLSHDFGNVDVGVSEMFTFTVTSQGDVDADIIYDIEAGQGCAGFAVNPKNLPAQVACLGGSSAFAQTCTSYQFDVVFAPQGQGQHACSVTIHYQSMYGSNVFLPPPIQVSVTGFGVAQQYAMDIVPTSTIQFGDVPVSDLSDQQMVRVTNSGGLGLTVTPSQTPPSGGAFSLSQCAVGSAFSLAPGVSKDCFVRCQPPAAGPYTGALTFAANNGLMRTANFECNGVTSDVRVTPSPVVFDNTLVGTPPGTKTIVIQNQGSATTQIQEIQINSSVGAELEFVATPVLPMPLAAFGGSGNFSLRYHAATAHPSGQLGTVVIRETNGNMRNVIVNGEALVGEIGTAPSSVDFGPICAGATANKPVEVYAAAAGSLVLDAVTKPGAPFDITTVMNQPLAGNHGPGVTLTASITATTEGAVADHFVLSSNAPGNMEHEVPMSAIVLPSGVSPTPAIVHFGPAAVDIPTTGREVTISNCSTSELSITAARFEGANGDSSATGAEFFIVIAPETVIQPGTSQNYLIAMLPKSDGPKTATFVVEHSAGMSAVTLDGTGFGADLGGNDRTTYYACSVGGGPGGALPIGLGLIGLACRRRRRVSAA